MQSIHTVHQLHLGLARWLAAVIDGASADVHQLRLAGQCQAVSAVNHRLTLSKPALLNAPCKKSFSKVS